MPIYDFERCSDGTPVEYFAEMTDEVCSIGEVVDIAGVPCKRLPSPGMQPRVSRDKHLKAWSLPLAGTTDKETGFRMPLPGEPGAPAYDKDGTPVFSGSRDIKEFCDNSQRLTNGEKGYSYGDW